MTDQLIVLDELDQLANEVFPGLVVRKDLLRRMRSAFGVPAFVIEFLLGKYCASTDEETIKRAWNSSGRRWPANTSSPTSGRR